MEEQARAFLESLGIEVDPEIDRCEIEVEE